MKPNSFRIHVCQSLAVAVLLLWGAALGHSAIPDAATAAKYESGLSAESLRQIERAVGETAGNPQARAELEKTLISLLGPGNTFEARRFACTQLAIVGSDASLPALAELLKNPETTGISCLALGSNPSAKANELLRAALTQLSGMARVQVIVTLGDRGDGAAGGALAEMARSADGSVAEASIVALGKIATSEALKALAGLRQDPSTAGAAVKASLVAADRIASQPVSKAAVGIYEELFKGQQPEYVRRAALDGLLRLDADGGEKRGLAVLRGPESGLKGVVISHLRRIKTPGASARFAREMGSLAAAERVQLIETLAARNDAEARTVITAHLTSPDPLVRAAAVAAFASIGDAGSVSVLAKALRETTQPAEQQSLEMALTSLKGGKSVDQEILKLLKGADARSKVNLMNVVARRGSAGAVPVLLAETGNAEADVATAAFRALGALADAGDLSRVLESFVALKTSAARSEAEDAVAKLIDRAGDPQKTSAALAGSIARARDIEARCALIQLLPACGGREAFVAVRSARADNQSPVRQAAFQAMTKWPDDLAVDSLLEAAQSPKDNTERVLALRAAVRLLAAPVYYSAREAGARFEKAIGLVKNVAEQKLVLAGLGNVHDPVALKLVEPFLAQPAVQAEAALAVMSMAPYVCGADRDATKAALMKVAEIAAVPQTVKQSARDLIEVINRFDDFIMAWEVAGPFSEEGKNGEALFDVVFPPEGANATSVRWQVMPAGGLKARPWQLDLTKIASGDNRVCYARTAIYSETEQPAQLEFGSDDGLKVWLNGKVVLTANRGGDVVPGAEKVAVTLQKGWNPLVLKVTQWSSGWGFCARVAKPDGSRIQGVRSDLTGLK